MINNDFSNKNYKLKIPTKTKTFVINSNYKIKETALIERKYVFEALIMRIMKSKKKISTNDLFEQII